MNDIEAKLKSATQRRDDALRIFNKDKSSLEGVIQARQRLREIISGLQKGDESDGQKRLLAALHQDLDTFEQRIKDLREERDKKQTTLKKLQQLVQRLRHRIGGGNIVMYDSVTVSEIPGNADAVAGYVNGIYTTWPQIQNEFSNAKRLSIAVTAGADADCLDIETGNAGPSEAAAWVRRQKSKGVSKPVVYAAISQMPSVLNSLQGAGISRDEVLIWTAHYNYKQHICTPACGFGLNTTADATQWTDHSGGKNLDESFCQGTFF